VAVFGAGARAFAEALAGERPALTLVTELRHAAGFEIARDAHVTRVLTHPSASLEALEAASPSADEAALTIGVGLAFACAVEADLVVWLRGADSMLSLPAAARGAARGAGLVLDGPNLGVARELGGLLLSPGDDRPAQAPPAQPPR
jgi:hypothetical protein